MSEDYRITIRTSEETADAFRGLAYKEEITLGDMLSEMTHAWEHQLQKTEDTSRLAQQYSA